MGRRGDKNWTREEHILAFELYCHITFGRQHSRAPEVIALAKVLQRTPDALAMKLNNFARLDPELHAQGIKGMRHGAKGEAEVWEEFESNRESLAFESQRLLAEYTGRTIEQVAEIDERDLPEHGLDRERLVRVRVNQHFFRSAVLAAYDYKCCITGLAVPELLVASHIIAWSKDTNQRMNPRNGLCLNALHDRAFDRGLMFFDQDLKVRFRDSVLKRDKSPGLDWLLAYESIQLCLPKKFQPDPSLLALHRGG